MAIVQGRDSREVPILTKGTENTFVQAFESEAIQTLNSQGKRVIHIERTKRGAGITEFSQYHVIINFLWEADTEDPKYKAFLAEEKRKADSAKAAELAKKAEKEEKKIQMQQEDEAHRKKCTASFWLQHSIEKEKLEEERDWLMKKSSSRLAQKRIDIIDKILTRERVGTGFSKYEKLQMQSRELFALKLEKPEAYESCITKIPELRELENIAGLEIGKSEIAEVFYFALIVGGFFLFGGSVVPGIVRVVSYLIVCLCAFIVVGSVILEIDNLKKAQKLRQLKKGLKKFETRKDEFLK